MSQNKSFLQNLIDLIVGLFSPRRPVPVPSTPPPPPTTGTAQSVTSKVLVVVYDPVVDAASGQKLSQKMRWFNADDLIRDYIADIAEASYGLARYEVVEKIEVDEFPVKKDGFRYTAQSFLALMDKKIEAHQPDLVDYGAILTQFNILQRVANREIDEVWLFAFPYAGFYESTMGGAGAFWCNSPALGGLAPAGRRFVIMGFSLQRGVGELHESFTHRCESIMEKVFEGRTGEANLFKRFIRYDKTSPGQAECGNVHFAPNSEKDYDWGNTRFVTSRCDDWYNYPNFKGVSRQVNCAEWGGGNIREHHKWWEKHFPHVGGQWAGIENNWWLYVIDPNNVKG